MNLLTQSGESISDPEELASKECEEACNARKVEFLLIETEGGGDAIAKSSSRLASVEFIFSLSSTCIASDP